jgi:hypothetical protein
METFVLRLWLPDRPGALGRVAGCIGAAQGDVIGIEILERGGGSAIDELTVRLPRADMLDRLIEEVRRVDGVAVEEARRVGSERPDVGIAALTMAADLVSCDPALRADAFCRGISELFEAEWSAVVGELDVEPIAHVGPVPDAGWLSAFVGGVRHLAERNETTPTDIAWSSIVGLRATAVIGRGGRPFHDRERQQIDLLAQILGKAAHATEVASASTMSGVVPYPAA